MRRLVITSTDAGAGCIKAARIAHKVIGLAHWLVSGPAPMTSDPTQFFSARASLVESKTAEETEVADVDLAFRKILTEAGQFDRAEFWIDPSCNAQLQLIQFLDWVRPNTDFVSKLVLYQANLAVGSRRPEDIASLDPIFCEVGEAELNTATASWSAYRQSSPVAWFALLDSNLTSLPRLSETVLRLLQELPAVSTALGATQLKLLEIIAAGEGRPGEVLRRLIQGYQQPVYGYWHYGRMLNDLAHFKSPLITGLAESPFDLALHDDTARFERYKRSSLALSDLGRAVVRGEEDFSRHNKVDRWWGGTRLTNDNLWRWDNVNQNLTPPTS